MGSEAQVCPCSSGSMAMGKEAPEDHCLLGESQCLRARIGTVSGSFASFPSCPISLLIHTCTRQPPLPGTAPVSESGVPLSWLSLLVTCEYSFTFPYTVSCIENILGVALATGDPHTASLEAPALQPKLFSCQWGLLGNPWASMSRCSQRAVLHSQACLCPTPSSTGWRQCDQPRAQDWGLISGSRQAPQSGEACCVRTASSEAHLTLPAKAACLPT